MSTSPLPATESRAPAAAFPLGLAAVSETLEIQGFRSGMDMVKRLAAMGLRPGTLCQVLQNERPGGIVLRVGQSRLALGMGMAHKILVTRK